MVNLLHPSGVTPADVLRGERLHGRVRISNGVDVCDTDNLVVYGAGDILMALLAGKPEYKISHLYVVYHNTTGTPTALAVTRSDTAATLRGVVSPMDCLRVPIYAPAALTAGDVNHAGNRATFVAVANATTGVNGVAFGPANNSKVVNIGLVAAPTGAAAGDILYAHYVLPTPLAVVGSGQISVSWLQEAV